MKNKIFVFIFMIFMLISCNAAKESNIKIFGEDSILIGKYKTEYIIYYGPGYVKSNIIYSDKEIYTCSFQGTNFLLEKDNTEEILSTTAPIQIIKSEIVK